MESSRDGETSRPKAPSGNSAGSPLWRTVKYEDVYLRGYADLHEAQRELAACFSFYNERWQHQALDWKTPGEVRRTQATAPPVDNTARKEDYGFA